MIATIKNKKKVLKTLTSVMEDYLEAIYDLSKEKRVVRVKDIAKRMSVKMPTVTSMLKTLGGRGLVHYEKYEYVELTIAGKNVGKEMRRRHTILQKFLIEILNVDAATADEDACKMEHALSPETLESLTDFIAFIQDCPRAGDSWLSRFEEYRRKGCVSDECELLSEAFFTELRNKKIETLSCPGDETGTRSREKSK